MTTPHDLRLLAKYGRPVPRYTSYPTAPHFGPVVDAACYGTWLEALDAAAEPLSLYLHIPFCRALCWFCGCNTRVVHNYDWIERYLGLLAKELALVTARLGGSRSVSHIHFGGGTPTMLAARDLARLADLLRDHFDVAADAEFAVEIDPRVLTAQQAKALGACRVTRASLGVQDFAPAVQKTINRVQPYAVTERAVAALRENGIARINLDLIYGLPFQTAESVVATVDQALKLDPDRLAVFGYAHVPWMKKHQRAIPEAALPDAAARFDQAQAIAERLRARGYVAIGLDHFARTDDEMALALSTGRLGRNFQGYTTDEAKTLIGLGASAIGALPQGYIQNAAALGTYAEAIEAGELAVERGVALSKEDRLRRAVISALMCRLEAPLAGLCRDHGRDPDYFGPEREALEEMVTDGIAAIKDGWVRVTDAGRPFVRTVCTAFDSYLAKGTARHSMAV
jgi:oxygen-independent coproporphyrinogen-3 oxidase